MSVAVPADRYVRRETAVSAAINAALSAAFFVALFRGLDPVAFWGEDRLAVDFLPQSFAIGLMSALVPGLLSRRARSRGAVAGPEGTGLTVGSVVLFALGAALAATLVGAGMMMLVQLSGAQAVPFAAALVAKVIYGAALALVVTPIAVRRAIA